MEGPAKMAAVLSEVERIALGHIGWARKDDAPPTFLPVHSHVFPFREAFQRIQAQRLEY